MSAVTQSVKPNDFYNSTSELSVDILSDTDPVEEQMNRTATRIAGFIFGSVLPIGGFQGFLLCDAWSDNTKIQMIEDRLARLSDADGHGVQKQIYTEIAQYTKSAQITKLVSGTIGALGAIRFQSVGTLDVISTGCFTALFAGIALSVIHRYTEGSDMKARHKQMILGQAALVL